MGHALGGGSLDFEAAKTAACRSALAVAARVVEAALNQNTRDYRGGSIPCSCEGNAVYAGRRIKQIWTMLGDMGLSRDEELGIGKGSCSPGMIRMIGSAAAEVSFAKATALIQERS